MDWSVHERRHFVFKRILCRWFSGEWAWRWQTECGMFTLTAGVINMMILDRIIFVSRLSGDTIEFEMSQSVCAHCNRRNKSTEMCVTGVVTPTEWRRTRMAWKFIVLFTTNAHFHTSVQRRRLSFIEAITRTHTHFYSPFITCGVFCLR